jgi:hypothetical protein
MRTHHATRSPAGRATFDTFNFKTVGGPLPLHLHVRCWRSDGTVASLLVYAPTRGTWYEGDSIPDDMRAFAVAALAEYLGEAPAFAFTSGVQS